MLFESKEAALSLIRQTLRLKPIFSEDAQARFARFIHEKLDDLSILEEINKEFRDPYSYHNLLAPMSDRLETLTQKYKGIEW